MVTEAERDYALSGKFDQLVEQQRRIDEERDAEVILMVCRVSSCLIVPFNMLSLPFSAEKTRRGVTERAGG